MLTIVDNPWFQLLGLLVAVAGVVLAVVFYYRGKRTTSLAWAIRTTRLIEGLTSRLPGLRVSYGEQNVDYVSVSNIVIWNDGTEVIHKADLKTGNPLRILGDGDNSLLNAQGPGTNAPSAGISMIDKPEVHREIELEFDYLNSGKGTNPGHPCRWTGARGRGGHGNQLDSKKNPKPANRAEHRWQSFSHRDSARDNGRSSLAFGFSRRSCFQSCYAAYAQSPRIFVRVHDLRDSNHSFTGYT